MKDKNAKAKKRGLTSQDRGTNDANQDSLRREVILAKAAGIFSKSGVAATSIQDIADAVGISRAALYYYFTSKEAILERLVRDVSNTPVALLESLQSDTKSSPGDRVRAAAHGLVLWVLDPHSHFNLIDRFESELPDTIAKANAASKRKVLAGMTTLIEEGIRHGQFRAVPARVAAFAIIGMCNWTARWFSPDGTFSAKQIAEMIADLATASVRRSGPTEPTSSVRDVVREIRGYLDLIDMFEQRARQAGR
jgi:AcrR family transcriptional regulator